MKKALFIFILAVSLIVWFFWNLAPQAHVTNYPSHGKNIIAFGDSLVRGYGANPGNDFVSYLSQKIGTPIMNLGRDGDTTADGLSRIEAVTTNDPKIVIVLFGGNDALQNIPPDETFANLGKIIEKIQQAGAIVILLGVQGGAINDPYKARFEQLAKQYNVAYIPNILYGIIGHDDLMSDAVHPNDAGYYKIANLIYPTLVQLNQ